MNTYYYALETTILATGEQALTVFESNVELTSSEMYEFATDFVDPQKATIECIYQTMCCEITTSPV
jgi:hypothetical protein